MNFSAHILSGAVAGAVVVTVGERYHLFPPSSSLPSFYTAMGYFFLTLLMSVFPDIDTASIPQRWFFRFVFILLLFLAYIQQYPLFLCITFLSLLPLLHHHRGWTHALWTPWLVGLLVVGLCEGILIKPMQWRIWSCWTIWSCVVKYRLLFFSIVLGHYTHIALDRLPLFSKKRFSR